jgi:hypothetical protein
MTSEPADDGVGVVHAGEHLCHDQRVVVEAAPNASHSRGIFDRIAFASSAGAAGSRRPATRKSSIARPATVSTLEVKRRG